MPFMHKADRFWGYKIDRRLQFSLQTCSNHISVSDLDIVPRPIFRDLIHSTGFDLSAWPADVGFPSTFAIIHADINLD
jgi:hypothetical protein